MIIIIIMILQSNSVLAKLAELAKNIFRYLCMVPNNIYKIIYILYYILYDKLLIRKNVQHYYGQRFTFSRPSAFNSYVVRICGSPIVVEVVVVVLRPAPAFSITHTRQTCHVPTCATN